jgi:hypothetical protein
MDEVIERVALEERHNLAQWWLGYKNARSFSVLDPRRMDDEAVWAYSEYHGNGDVHTLRVCSKLLTTDALDFFTPKERAWFTVGYLQGILAGKEAIQREKRRN